MEPVPLFLFLGVEEEESWVPPVRLNDKAMYLPERGTARPDMISCCCGRGWDFVSVELVAWFDAALEVEEGKGMRSSIRRSSPPKETSFPNS